MYSLIDLIIYNRLIRCKKGVHMKSKNSNLIYKLERKFSKYAIHNLMYYIIILIALGWVLDLVSPGLYEHFFSLNIEQVFHGQIWRLVTFIIKPSTDNILFLFIELYLYYSIGKALENSWGAFRFNLYFISGILFNILAAIIIYVFLGTSNVGIGLTFVNRSLFFAFAALYPNVQFLLFYIIPVKVKYLGYLYGITIAYDVFQYIVSGNYILAIFILVALANFLIYFILTRNYKRISPSEFKRKTTYRNQVKKATTITRHKCAVCGRTEKDDEDLEFRFCSKCDGNYEYCMEHLFTHEHVHHK